MACRGPEAVTFSKGPEYNTAAEVCNEGRETEGSKTVENDRKCDEKAIIFKPSLVGMENAGDKQPHEG